MDTRKTTIFDSGRNSLRGRLIHTERGPQRIKEIYTHRYKQCRIVLEDGTDRFVDFNEPIILILEAHL